MVAGKNKISDTDFMSLIAGIKDGYMPAREEWRLLLEEVDNELLEYLFSEASSLSDSIFGKSIYVRGLIEISAYCRNDCYYCGLRRSNAEASRYRLSCDEIMQCCDEGDSLGIKTFVFQGGEDRAQSDEWIAEMVSAVKGKYPGHAVTLSVGERSYQAYKMFRDAGADRYLLRHETADFAHYAMLHPEDMSPQNRRRCLMQLKELGFQTGAGMMIGSPWQTVGNLIDDIFFLYELQPEMIGMGPFIPASGTPFSDKEPGSADMTIRLVALMRLLFPKALIPATTALATILPDGRERAVRAGANVVMPNLSPFAVRSKYSIYDNKAHGGAESAQTINLLEQQFNKIGYHLDYSRGDFKK